MSGQLRFHPENEAVLAWLAQGRLSSKESFELRQKAEALSLASGFDRLVALDDLSLRLYDHQRTAVLRVLRDMRGRAVLADEVGLGKTIEAGVIAREYIVRGLVRRLLILVPATLVEQWRGELASQLRLSFEVDRGKEHWTGQDRIIASLDMAKRPLHAARLQSLPWDLVIVDEAHRLKNRNSVGWKFVNSLQTKYLLLLTATPIQNDLEELFSLITLLKPGQLSTFARFKRDFMLDRHAPKNVEALRSLLSDVIVRTVRRDTLLPFPRRIVRSVSVRMSDSEQHFYRELVAALRASYRQTPVEERNLLPYILLLRQATSHPLACTRTLTNMVRRGTLPLIEPASVQKISTLARTILPAKAAALRETLHETNFHAIVYTGFRTTAFQVAAYLRGTGCPCVGVFHGGLDLHRRQSVLDEFRRRKGILVSTETGSEGMNLQFCRAIVNYDLPWNPLRLEQRIGRVHRLGQKEDVLIYNLTVAGTVESYLLYLLEKKLAMFHSVIGDLEAVLTHVDGSFDERVAEAYLTSDEDEPGSLPESLEAFGSELTEAVQQWTRKRRVADTLLQAVPEREDILSVR